MNKKGFTLIELLAVIVILAIIALIATPIVLNIIDDAKKESDLRSADFYLKSLELGIAQAILDEQNITDGVYSIMSNGNVCLESGKVDNCATDKTLVVEVKGKKATFGTIVIENGQIVEKLSTDESKKTELVINDQTIVMKDGELQYPEEQKSICKLQEGYIANEIGSKYECEVKPGTKYYFYILSKEEDGTTNLIMDRNINSDGTPTTKAIKEADKDSNGGIYNLVAYNLSGDASGTGPVTAMNFLNKATSSWSNIPNINITYDDEGGHFTGFVLNGKARMPYISEVTDSNGTNEYLYEYLDDSDWYGTEGKKPTNNISGIYGYWTLSSNLDDSSFAWYVGCDGSLHHFDDDVSVDYGSGVRPVINLKI